MNSPFTWLLRREVWETRAVWIAPAICAAIVVVSSVVGGLQLGDVRLSSLSDPELAKRVAGLSGDRVAGIGSMLMVALAIPFYITMQFVQFFYAMDALSSDRRDRSVLFWKSLPVSDASTVASKLVTAAVVIPLVALAAALVTQLVVFAFTGLRISGAGLPFAAEFFSIRAWAPAFAATVYGAFASMLWSLPLVGWLLFVSASAPRAPFLWAVLPPLALVLAEEIVFDTNHLLKLMAGRTVGLFEAAFTDRDAQGDKITVDLDSGVTASFAEFARPLEFLASPEVWGGALVGAAFVAAAIWARRYRDDTA